MNKKQFLKKLNAEIKKSYGFKSAVSDSGDIIVENALKLKHEPSFVNIRVVDDVAVEMVFNLFFFRIIDVGSSNRKELLEIVNELNKNLFLIFAVDDTSGITRVKCSPFFIPPIPEDGSIDELVEIYAMVFDQFVQLLKVYNKNGSFGKIIDFMQRCLWKKLRMV